MALKMITFGRNEGKSDDENCEEVEHLPPLWVADEDVPKDNLINARINCLIKALIVILRILVFMHGDFQ